MYVRFVVDATVYWFHSFVVIAVVVVVVVVVVCVFGCVFGSC
jgi:hypothetical protein